MVVLSLIDQSKLAGRSEVPRGKQETSTKSSERRNGKKRFYKAHATSPPLLYSGYLSEALGVDGT